MPEAPSKLWSHTCSMIMLRERTRPALAIRYSSKEYSLPVSSIRRPPRFTCCEMRSSSRSPIRRLLARLTGPRLKERLDSNKKLSKRERLGEIVVRAELHVADFVVYGVARAQYENGNIRI